MFPEQADSPTFGYSYKVFPGTDPNAATIVFLPGGPGGTSISVERDEDHAPASYTLIATDPRGVGCNAAPSSDYYPDEFYSSLHFADDVIAIIEREKLDNYLIYGVSYGTQLATMVATSTWLVMCTYPTGETGLKSLPYQVGTVAVALLAAATLLRRDPLHVRGPSRRQDTGQPEPTGPTEPTVTATP